jgi:hypothetical protein
MSKDWTFGEVMFITLITKNKELFREVKNL